MYKYESIILPYIKGKYNITDKGELQTHCPFCNMFDKDSDELPLHISLEKGLYNCMNGCRTKRESCRFYCNK